jgi:peptidoglycan/xylan/chitin deacetylase (PgdA/CDA1 family)
MFHARTALTFLAAAFLPLIVIGAAAQSTRHSQPASTSATSTPIIATHTSTSVMPFATAQSPTPHTPRTAAGAAARASTAEELPSRLAKRPVEYIPILMYHYIRTVDENVDPVGFRLSVTPERFAEQMQWLADNHYTPIRMDALAGCLRAEITCPRKPVALTFDDGYADAATAALPILKQHGFTATFYVIVDFIGKPGFLSWKQVRSMHKNGMEIGSHTLSHADLTGLSPQQAQYEIERSKSILEQRLDAPVRSFSYPAGSYSLLHVGMARRAGYTNAVTTSPLIGFAHLYTLSRRRVLGGEAIEGFPWYMAPAP